MQCQGFLERLDKLNKFRLHTGNINTYSELKLRRYTTSAEELSACLRIQLQSTPHASDFRDDGTLLLCDNAHIDDYERDDLKITMKVFVSEWDASQLTDAVAALLEQLNTDSVELLIVSLPDINVIEGETDEQETVRWLDAVKPLWLALEKLVDSSVIVSLGISDANLLQVSALCEAGWANIKPTVDHINLDGCCVVPPDLQAYAKENDIQLLTHNDPKPFPTNEVFNTFCDMKQSSPVCCSSFETTWAARYTVWVRRRSVMASKGYLVQFVRS